MPEWPGRRRAAVWRGLPGVQSEMELAFAGLHQLLAPMLDRLERLPVPQRDALQTASGVSAGPAPDRYLVGLAVLRLLSDVAKERPLVACVGRIGAPAGRVEVTLTVVVGLLMWAGAGGFASLAAA
jgi:hypothetical protein